MGQETLEEEASMLQLRGQESAVNASELELSSSPSAQCGAGGECAEGGCCYNRKYSPHYTCAAAGNVCCFSNNMVYPLASCSQCHGGYCEEAGLPKNFWRQPPMFGCGAGGECGEGQCCYNPRFSNHYVCAAKGNVCCFQDKQVFPLASCDHCSGHCQKGK
jgi:hypothetical protein